MSYQEFSVHLVFDRNILNLFIVGWLTSLDFNCHRRCAWRDREANDRFWSLLYQWQFRCKAWGPYIHLYLRRKRFWSWAQDWQLDILQRLISIARKGRQGPTARRNHFPWFLNVLSAKEIKQITQIITKARKKNSCHLTMMWFVGCEWCLRMDSLHSPTISYLLLMVCNVLVIGNSIAKSFSFLVTEKKINWRSDPFFDGA